MIDPIGTALVIAILAVLYLIQRQERQLANRVTPPSGDWDWPERHDERLPL